MQLKWNIPNYDYDYHIIVDAFVGIYDSIFCFKASLKWNLFVEF